MISKIEGAIMVKMANSVDDIYEIGQAKMDIHEMLLTMMRLGILTRDEYVHLESYLDDYYHMMKDLNRQLAHSEAR